MMNKTASDNKWQEIRHRIEQQKGIFLFAHRGCSQKAPENTMAAFQSVKDANIPGVELDVQRCKTGELIVCHDFDLKRVSGKDVTIEDMPYEEIKDLDIGSWFSSDYSNQRLPRLEEVFELLGDRVIYNIETKTDKPKTGPLEEGLLKIIEKYHLEGNCIVSSFNPFSIKTINKLNPEIPVSLIYSRTKKLPFILRHGEGRLLTKKLFIQVHHKLLNNVSSFFHRTIFGNPIIAWTIDDPKRAIEMIKLGVIGIISNNPAVIREALLKEGRTIISPDDKILL